MQEAYSLMNEIKASYVWEKPCGDFKIAEMMVMDACFILEYLVKIQDHADQSYSGRLLHRYSVLHDMLLLENQIPMVFLDKIFQCTILKFKSISLVELILPVLKAHNLFGVDMKTNNISIDHTTLHILDLLHKCCTPQNYNTTNTEPASRIPTHSAVNLYRAGVNIRPNQNPTWPMQLEVQKNCFPCFFGWSMLSLKMPVLKVHDSTEFLLRNLIAYEQSFQTDKPHRYVTSFALAMDMLMNTQEDVAKLIDSGVLINHLGSNEEAANMINNICKHVTWEEFIYEEQWKKMDDYCNSYWPKQIAKMWTTYFSSPWSMIALIAGIMLFTLAVIDTIFTVNPPE
ncbi:hypothetical protein HanRHA438_Chr01g0021231 [Helianthus annuus]|nr:hypothetical protein HanHA300_Chr01g0016931 [Helianthus annuus]KAJ0783176.1 hypothetical protein HanLR1_Chr01g0017381 [Helianthus annuus]KAJ0947907.1 hypothetical protein HanRHA438_Chr01g0021231 [Helianthus annuus]